MSVSDPTNNGWNKDKTRKLLSLVSNRRGVPYMSRALGVSETEVLAECQRLKLDVTGHCKPVRVSKARLRECLHCHNDFMSRDAGNRICPNCTKTVNNNANSFDVHYLGA